MNPSHCLHWYRTQVLLHSNTIRSLAFRKYIVSSNLDTKFDVANQFNGRTNTRIQKVHVRSYRRFMRRRPIDVIEKVKSKTIEEYVLDTKAEAVAPVLVDDETDISSEIHYNIIEEPKKKDKSIVTQSPDDFIRPQKQKKQTPYKSRVESPEHESDSEDDKRVFRGLNIQLYTKSRRETRMYIERGKSARFREENDFFCVEGWRLLAEGLMVGLKPLAIYFSRSRLMYNLIPTVAKTTEELTNLLNLCPLYKTPYSVFTTWSTLKTPPGIMAAFSISKAIEIPSQQKTKDSLPFTVILDEIRDPNNLGSIIRTLVAAGVSKIILTKGCCDLWDSKVLRSTCGAHFHMHCLTKVPWSMMETYFPPSPSVYLANACHARDDYILKEDAEKDPEVRSDFPEDLERIREISLVQSEEQSSYKIGEDGDKLRVNDSYRNPDHMNLFSNISFPNYQYDTINYFSSEVGNAGQSAILIIGGETGLSNNANKFALENGGIQVNIPMENNIDSLNSAVAIGILVYEAKKQYKQQLVTQANETITVS